MQDKPQKIRFTREQLIAEFGEDAYFRILATCNIYQRAFPTKRINNAESVPVTWLIVPSRHRKALTVITDYEWGLQQDGVGGIIHDKLELK